MPTTRWQDPAVIERVLARSVWAVVGLDDDPRRPAWDVARFLQAKGRAIRPVHPRAVPVHGEPGYATLDDVPGEIDVVDVFVRSERAGAVVDAAVARGAGAVWLQVGVVDEDAAERAAAAGLDVVMDTCPKIVWR